MKRADQPLPIMGPNYVAISGMPGADLVRTREMWIAKFVNVWRAQNDAGIKQSADWIVALTSEMRLRGTNTKEIRQGGLPGPP